VVLVVVVSGSVALLLLLVSAVVATSPESCRIDTDVGSEHTAPEAPSEYLLENVEVVHIRVGRVGLALLSVVFREVFVALAVVDLFLLFVFEDAHDFGEFLEGVV